ncbi:transferase family-domain-containing protein [Hygrophoropsis aurantiaca]|uniref:Transferase family-domain-containing protein n=1 Tax=Hygrophoropsis aurantiaca TaxID=72124 RepID=A0ACB8ADP1_9AGAM|nr:transferase family-domain-containing protein [Hygrophoropsis aurantiaca]
MRGPAITTDLHDSGSEPEYHDLSILEQIPFHSNTQICLCFPVADASSGSHAAIIHTLTNGLERLSASFPWLAGKVVRVHEGSDPGSSGILKIQPLKPEIPRLIVKDLRDDTSMPKMDALRRADFPMRMLDENIIAPRKTFFHESASDPDPAPVFLIQANFITGGLLLTFDSHHNAMDKSGQYQVMRLFSKACRGEQFTSDELSSGNLPRRDLIPLLDDAYSYTPDSELVRRIAVRAPSAPSCPTDASPPPKCTWAYFTFPPTALAALKSRATETLTLPSAAAGYISTDDALTAFIWQSTTRVRLPRLHSDPTAAPASTLARAVNVRRYLGIPQTYPGAAVNMTYHTYAPQTLVGAPLGGIAAGLRAAVDPKTADLGHRTRALATMLHRTPDKDTVGFIAALDLSADVMVSSWAQVGCLGLDFGLGLGEAEAARRPRFQEAEGLVYLMPRAVGGEGVVAVCLREEEMQRLREDAEFGEYARYVG